VRAGHALFKRGGATLARPIYLRDLFNAPMYGWRRWTQIARPDRSVVELDDHAIRRIDGALVPGVDPDPRRRRKQVRPCPGGLTGFVEKIEVGSVLGDECGTAGRARPTSFDAFMPRSD